MRELQEIQVRWEEAMKKLDEEICKARKIRIQVEDDEAYQKCVNLLMDQFETEQMIAQKSAKKTRIQISTLEEHISLMYKEIQDKRSQILLFKHENREIDKHISNKITQKNKAEAFKEKIEDYLIRIDIDNKKLQEYKEKSHEQKNEYIEAQAIQFNINRQIAQTEEDQLRYEAAKKDEEHHRKLIKIRDRLKAKKDSENTDVQSYLEDKINEISALRADLNQLNSTIQNIETKIEDQQFIMRALREKAMQREEDDQNLLFNKYRDKYQKIYFQTEESAENWKDYKHYLTALTKEKKKNSKVSSAFVRKENNSLTSPIQEQNETDRSVTSHRILKKGSMGASHLDPEKSASKMGKLPKLVKMSGTEQQQAQIKQKLKSNIKNIMDREDISLESVGSESQISGEFIEVEFHRKK